MNKNKNNSINFSLCPVITRVEPSVFLGKEILNDVGFIEFLGIFVNSDLTRKGHGGQVMQEVF